MDRDPADPSLNGAAQGTNNTKFRAKRAYFVGIII